jgi:hypothetical protein
VFGGGSLNIEAANVRAANRNNNAPANRNKNIGFRPASTLPCPNPLSSLHRMAWPNEVDARQVR